jgi:hypothetical protein
MAASANAASPAAAIPGASMPGAPAGSGVGGCGGRTIFTRRGGGSGAAVGFGGSGPRAAPGLRVFTAGESENITEGGGTEMPRWRASRSTNWRATTSSMVLDALLTSMPWSRLRSAITS